MATWYFDFVNFNNTGYRPYGITVWAVTLGDVRKTVSRLLVLVVAMGFGVVRPTLGGLTNKVLLLGGAYLLAAEALDLINNVGAIDDLNKVERIVLVLPVAVMDAIFILWIFTALSKTLALLQVGACPCNTQVVVGHPGGGPNLHLGVAKQPEGRMRLAVNHAIVSVIGRLIGMHAKQTRANTLLPYPLPQAKRTTPKLELYRRFTNSLAFAIVISVAWIGYEVRAFLTGASCATQRCQVPGPFNLYMLLLGSNLASSITTPGFMSGPIRAVYP